MDKPENIYEAIEFMVDTNVGRQNRKQVAGALRPNKTIDSVKAWFSKCISGDGDVNFTPGDIEMICEKTGQAGILIAYLCERFGYEIPPKKPDNLTPESEIIILRRALKENGIDVQQYLEDHKNLFSVHFKKQQLDQGDEQ